MGAIKCLESILCRIFPFILLLHANILYATVSDDEALGVCGTACGSFVFIIIAILILHIAILVWVAKDAKNRGMGSPVGWIFLILFTGIIGLIIYLFSRPKGELVYCNICKNKKFKVTKVCPHCGNASSTVETKTISRSQNTYCSKCGNKVFQDASFCEQCGKKIETS